MDEKLLNVTRSKVEGGERGKRGDDNWNGITNVHYFADNSVVLLISAEREQDFDVFWQFGSSGK